MDDVFLTLIKKSSADSNNNADENGRPSSNKHTQGIGNFRATHAKPSYLKVNLGENDYEMEMNEFGEIRPFRNMPHPRHTCRAIPHGVHQLQGSTTPKAERTYKTLDEICCSQGRGSTLDSRGMRGQRLPGSIPGTPRNMTPCVHSAHNQTATMSSTFMDNRNQKGQNKHPLKPMSYTMKCNPNLSAGAFQCGAGNSGVLRSAFTPIPRGKQELLQQQSQQQELQQQQQQQQQQEIQQQLGCAFGTCNFLATPMRQVKREMPNNTLGQMSFQTHPHHHTHQESFGEEMSQESQAYQLVTDPRVMGQFQGMPQYTQYVLTPNNIFPIQIPFMGMQEEGSFPGTPSQNNSTYQMLPKALCISDESPATPLQVGGDNETENFSGESLPPIIFSQQHLEASGANSELFLQGNYMKNSNNQANNLDSSQGPVEQMEEKYTQKKGSRSSEEREVVQDSMRQNKEDTKPKRGRSGGQLPSTSSERSGSRGAGAKGLSGHNKGLSVTPKDRAFLETSDI